MRIPNFESNFNFLCDYLKKKAIYEDVSVMNYYNLIHLMKEYIEDLESVMKQLEIELYTKYHEHKDSECEELYARAQEDKEILDYIKELKVNK